MMGPESRWPRIASRFQPKAFGAGSNSSPCPGRPSRPHRSASTIAGSDSWRAPCACPQDVVQRLVRCRPRARGTRGRARVRRASYNPTPWRSPRTRLWYPTRSRPRRHPSAVERPKQPAHMQPRTLRRIGLDMGDDRWRTASLDRRAARGDGRAFAISRAGMQGVFPGANRPTPYQSRAPGAAGQPRSYQEPRAQSRDRRAPCFSGGGRNGASVVRSRLATGRVLRACTTLSGRP
jgi:hypothetical protein